MFSIFKICAGYEGAGLESADEIMNNKRQLPPGGGDVGKDVLQKCTFSNTNSIDVVYFPVEIYTFKFLE